MLWAEAMRRALVHTAGIALGILAAHLFLEVVNRGLLR